MTDRVRVVVVTGLSGAGKSTALNSLEDLGYFCVDNLPTALLEQTVEVCEAGGIRRIGLGVDVRVGSFLEGALPALDRIREGDRELGVLFLDASDEVILRRYSESRRPHPLTGGGREGMRPLASTAPPVPAAPAGLAGLSTPTPAPASPQAPAAPAIGAVAVLDGIRLERERLAPLRASATVVIDSTLLSVHDLRRQVIAHLGPGKAEQPRMVTRVVSFGFKYGVPVDADVVLDVRLLDNPFFVPDLRDRPGTDPLVRDYVLASAETQELIEKTEALLAFALPRYEREGKSYLTIAIGCTGGRHRSVTVATELCERLRRKTELPIFVFHRDVARADIFGSYPPLRGGSGGSP